MSGSVLHLVFKMSAAGTLGAALRQAGRNERVIGLSDSLSFGPIDPPDPALRTAWVDRELEVSGWDQVGGQAASSWDEAISRNVRRIAWLTRTPHPTACVDGPAMPSPARGEGAVSRRLSQSLC